MKYLESFFWGVIAAMGALTVELIFSQIAQMPDSASNFSAAVWTISPSWFLLVGAFIEESFKFLVIAGRIAKIFSGGGLFVSSLILGAGFSAFEIFLIFQNSGIGGNPNVAGIISVGFLHISAAGIIGILWPYFKNKPGIYLTAPLVVSLIVHFAFNWLVIYNF
jgi:hypothetical protein